MHEFGPALLGQVNGHVIDGHPRQRDADPDERIDGVSIQRHDDQEQAAQTVDEGEEQGQLWREKVTNVVSLYTHSFIYAQIFY